MRESMERLDRRCETRGEVEVMMMYEERTQKRV